VDLHCYVLASAFQRDNCNGEPAGLAYCIGCAATTRIFVAPARMPPRLPAKAATRENEAEI
jgi:hypothetical protein